MTHPWSSQQFGSGARAAGRTEQVIAAAQASANAIKSVHPDLPVILTLKHLAHLTAVAVDDLQAVIFRQEDPYRVFRVKKRGTPNSISAPPRRYRTICVPTPSIMRVQRWIAQNILNVTIPHETSFAFTPKRDLVGAAHKHLEAKWLVKLDVRHFFESILEQRVYRVFRSLGYGALLSFQMARLCTRLARHRALDTRSSEGRGAATLPYRRHSQGHLPQGAPTSPMLANLVMRPFDRRIETLASQLGWTYTRYADDLAFSRRDQSSRKIAFQLAKRIEHELTQFGLANNRQKTSIAPPGARKLLLGVLVDRETPRLTREFRNNIETHLYALLSPKIGPRAHQAKRGFASAIGMRRHIEGLIAYAHHVDGTYGDKLYKQFNKIDWNA
jgi:RNA-directed DNA polymerase